MKIILMQRLTMDGESVEYKPSEENGEDYEDWWGVIETPEEKTIYDDFVKHLGEYDGDCRDILWNKLVIHAGQEMNVCWGDDDMYGYIMPDETAPEVGEKYTDADGDEWIRKE